MPEFRKSPPELIARFDELAPLAAEADRTMMFGYPVYVLRGNMFMGMHAGSLFRAWVMQAGQSSSAGTARACLSPSRADR